MNYRQGPVAFSQLRRPRETDLLACMSQVRWISCLVHAGWYPANLHTGKVQVDDQRDCWPYQWTVGV